MVSALPQHIGPYRVLRYLGGGGFAEVLLGQDTRPHFQGAYVALKRLREEITTPPLPQEGQDTGALGSEGERARSDVFRRSLLSEGQIAQGLSNPHVVKVDGLIAHNGDPVVVMEYIEGFGLDQLLTLYSGRGIPDPWVGSCLLQLTRALEALHSPREWARSASWLSSVTFGILGEGEGHLGAERGIVHQDLKPSNIRITPKGVVKVLDLGIAAPLRTPLERIRQGTPGYRSPEQIMGARSLTPTSDLYTLGILGFELSTGRRLFPEAICHDPVALKAARNALPDTLKRAENAGELPIGLRPILDSLLSQGRGDRPGAAAQVEARLRQWLGSMEAQPPEFGEWCQGVHRRLHSQGSAEGADILSQGGPTLSDEPQEVVKSRPAQPKQGHVGLGMFSRGVAALGLILVLSALAFTLGIYLSLGIINP